MTGHEDEVVRKRQRERARLMALLLGAFVVLMFVITIAKMAVEPVTALAQRNTRTGAARWRCSGWRCSASPSPRCRSTACSAR